MSIYLYICQSEQLFSDVCTQLPVNFLELSIDHREGHVALAGLVLPANEDIPTSGWAFIVTDDRGQREPIFKGQFIGLPKRIDETTKYVELLATPVNLTHKVRTLLAPLQEKHKDCLLLRGIKNSEPADYLEFYQKLFCYDRVSHEVTLSSVFHGTRSQTYNTQILQDSLHFRINDTPLPGVHLSLVCEWIQELRGEINLIPKIELKFPQGRISTLSPKGLVASWPYTGQLFGRSGYAVVRSSLQEFQPLSTGLLGHYPTTTPLIQGKKYKNFWFQAELILEWVYRQKRREQLDVIIHHQNQYLATSTRPFRKIKLRLNKLPPEMLTQPNFFDTEEGHKVIKNALKIAQSHLAYSARAAEVKFQVAFEEALDLTLDHQITVHHPSLPSGKVSGKLTSYRLERRYDRAVAYLTVAIATGIGNLASFEIAWHHKDELKGISEPGALSADYFIESLSVHNHSQEQINWLKDQETSISVLPSEMATRIDFTLKDLRSSDVIERKLHPRDIHWSAPNQLGNYKEEL